MGRTLTGFFAVLKGLTLSVALSQKISNRVSRLRERQYQLAAQKNNEAFSKYDYHHQNAKYFERECTNAKHYDSWNSKQPDPKGHLEKARKTEHLLGRRNRLRSLLKEEEEIYQREIAEIKSKKNLKEEPSMESLKEKLKERRAEQSLYLPKTCRRYQSHFVQPNEPIGRNSNTLRNTNLHYSAATKGLNEFTIRNGRNSHSDGFTMNGNENGNQNENENRSETGSLSMKENEDSQRNSDAFRKVKRTQQDTRSYDNQKTNSDVYKNNSERRSNDKISASTPQRDENDFQSLSLKSPETHQSEPTRNSRGNESNECILTHNAFKCKIEDFAKREMHACSKHSWDDALRFRDMRKRLELTREKQLYNTDNFEMNEEVRKLGLENIDRKEKELVRREDAYKDSELYSDGARALLKEWMREDERSMTKDGNSVLDDMRERRENLMEDLEKE